MSKTVVLLNPMGTDVTNFLNHTAGVAQLMNGSVASPGDTVYTLPYTNQPGVSNISAGKALLDTKLKSTTGEVLVFGYSEGCQIADWWLADQGATPASGVDPALVSFLMIGNADRKYGGFSYNRSIFNSVGYTAGKPDNTPYTCVDFARQYDPICDFPTATPIVNALLGLSYVGSDQNVYAGAMNAVAAIMGNTAYSQAVSNAAVGLMWIHTGLGVAGTGYMSVTVSDPVNLSLADGNITWVWSPTYPVPLLGTGGTFPTSDHQLRTVIEQAYTRPVTIPMPDYGRNSGWGVEPFPLPVSPPPVTGWWAELHVSCHLTVTPSVSAAPGHSGSSAIVVAPSLTVTINTTHISTVADTITPTITASGAAGALDSAAMSISPAVSAGVVLIKQTTVTVTITPTLNMGAGSQDGASVSVTPSVSVSMAVIGSIISAAPTITPTVSAAVTGVDGAAINVTPTVVVAAVVTRLGNVAIPVTPAVTVAGAVTLFAATAITPATSVAVTAEETEGVTIVAAPTIIPALTAIDSASVNVTPTVTVGLGKMVFADVAITVTPTVAVGGGVTLFSSVTETVTPTVTASVSAAPSETITVTPSVSASAVAAPGESITVTPTVTATAVVTRFANVTVGVTPSVTVGGTVTEFATATVPVAPTITAISDTAVSVADTITPTVSPVVAGVVGESITVTPTVTANAGVLWTDTVAVSVAPSVSPTDQAVGSAAIAVTPAVTVAASVVSGPSYDATGAGAQGAGGTSHTWSHTATAGAYVVVFAFNGGGTMTAKYGSTSMTSLGSITDGSSNKLYMFGLAGVAGGAITVTVTSSGFNGGNSVSYTSVASHGTAQTYSSGSVSTYSQSVTCTSGQVIAQAFENGNGFITSASGGTNRWSPSSNFGAMAISDATTTTTFTASLSSAAAGAGIAVVLS